MTESQDSNSIILLQDLKDAAMCMICLQEYTLNDRAPTSLTCGHTFCRICVLKLGRHMIQCATCRARMAASSTVKNYGLITLLDKFSLLKTDVATPIENVPTPTWYDDDLYFSDSEIPAFRSTWFESTRHFPLSGDREPWIGNGDWSLETGVRAVSEINLDRDLDYVDIETNDSVAGEASSLSENFVWRNSSSMGDSDVEYLHTVHFADISDNESRVIDATGDGYVPGDQEIGGNDDVSNYINIWDSEIPEEEPELTGYEEAFSHRPIVNANMDEEELDRLESTSSHEAWAVAGAVVESEQSFTYENENRILNEANGYWSNQIRIAESDAYSTTAQFYDEEDEFFDMDVLNEFYSDAEYEQLFEYDAEDELEYDCDGEVNGDEIDIVDEFVVEW